MRTERRNTLARCLSWLICLIAGLLVAVVLLAPLYDTAEPVPEGWDRLVALFARDSTLRRTCLASAAGLVVSACVFFRPAGVPNHPASSQAPRRPRSSGVAGA